MEKKIDNGKRNLKNDFNKRIGSRTAVQIKLASSDQIRVEWASGKITESETLNYRTLRPVNGGLFCAQIFGPINDYECLCKRYKGIKYDGIICERCNVQVSKSSVRKERMGYIDLHTYVVHPWFFRNNNKISALLDIQLKELKKIVNLEKYVIFMPGTTNFKTGDIISASDYELYLYADGFEAETGAEALKRLLESVDLEDKIKEFKELILKTNSMIVKKKYRLILNLCEGMLNSGVHPSWMILDTIPVIPADMRPLVEIEGGQFVSADINDLYRSLIYRVKRLELLIKNRISIPLILHNEIRMIQEAVNRLFGSGSEDGKDLDKKYKSLEDRIKGKEGSLRKSMLGKRVDFSARSVIVVEPTLKVNECFLPKEMMLELLKPVIIGYLRLYGFSSSIKQAKRFIELRKPEIWDILNEIIQGPYPVVLLNRAPTLHRIGIIGFKIKLWNKKAIGLHPLVCPAFNADFDGDQMAVHLPLSIESIAEVLNLQLHDKNLGSATDGSLTVGAFKDIALGIYVLTLSNEQEKNLYFNSVSHLEYAILYEKIKVNDLIYYYIQENDPITKKVIQQMYKTTAGRVLLWNIIPKHKELSFELINKALNNQDVQHLMKQVRLHCGDNILAQFADAIKSLGFKYANKYTASIGKDDFIQIPNAKEKISEAVQKHIDLSIQLEEGLITKNEMTMRAEEMWKKVQQYGEKEVKKIMIENPFNPMFILINSGARGSTRQILQMFFMKGKIVGMNGEILLMPIIDNHCDGIRMFLYVFCFIGIRKVCTDVALKTAEGGYLTRKLVEIAIQVIQQWNCGTKKYLVAKNIFRGTKIQSTVYEKILKRLTALDIKNPETGKVLIPKGVLLDEKKVELIQQYGITEVAIRSPVLCELTNGGVCACCYGGDLSTVSDMVNIGEPVGVIAAQSIGEPGTQLTMKSFHSGGVAQFGIIETELPTPFAGKIDFINEKIIIDKSGNQINVSRTFKIVVLNQYSMVLCDFPISYGAKILVNKGDMVNINDILATWKDEQPIIAEFPGIIKYINLFKGMNFEEITESSTGLKKKFIIEYKVLPNMILTMSDGTEINYFLPINTILNVSDGDVITPGNVLGYTIHKESSLDIVGGLQQVVNMFENRMVIKPAIVSNYEGTIHIKNDKKGKSVVIITNAEGVENEIVITHGILAVQNGQYVKPGDLLTNGTPSMQDVLDYQGINVLAETFIKELQNVYMEQGIKINDKHLEVILHQMCRKYEVINPGGSSLLPGRILDIVELQQYNAKLSAGHKQQIDARQLIYGITNASLESISFLSAASFQETINVITNAGLMGSIDELSTIKSNMILGDFIPAGTGFAINKFLQLAENYKNKNAAAEET